MKLIRIFYAAFTFFCIEAPLPPGPIDRNQSNFHPEKLHLKWTVPINNTRVDSYLVTIRKLNSIINTSNPSTNDLEITSMRFEPGTNYTVTIYAKSYGSQSQPHVEKIKTLRKYTGFFISIFDIVTYMFMNELTIL